MFLWDFAVKNVMTQFLDWLYAQVVDFLGQFLAMMNLMGTELFELDWIKSIILFFQMLGWSLFTVGLAVSVFDTVIEMQNGRGSVRDTAINLIKGFMAASLFSVVPIELYKTSVTLQSGMISSIAGLGSSFDGISTMGMTLIESIVIPGSNSIVLLIIVILIGYAIIKVFFANLKRGGILLTMIAVGSLYMFSVPRGYMDGFVAWCKQVIALCVTAFLQTIVLVAGLQTFNANMLLGVGLMLSATEVPRIANHFGLDTGTKTNFMSAAYTAQSAINLVKTAVTVVK